MIRPFSGYSSLGDYRFAKIAWGLVFGFLSFRGLAVMAIVVGNRNIPGFSVTRMFLSIVTGKALFKLVAYVIAVLVFCVAFSAIWYIDEMRLYSAFQAMRRIDPLPEAKKLLQEKGHCDALEYLDYMREYDYVKSDPRVTDFYNELKSERTSVKMILSEVIRGILTGKGSCVEAWGAATASDFFLVGDIRDIVIQILNWLEGDKVDEFTFVLSGVGLLTTADPPAEGALCALKLGKRLNKLSTPFQKSIMKVGKQCINSRNLKAFKPITESFYTMFKTPGVRAVDIMSVLKHCDNVADLRLMSKFASAFGPKTGKFLRLGGGASVDIFQKYRHSKYLKKALDDALQFGRKGTDMLKRIGPEEFLKLTKLIARGSKTVWQGRLQMFIAWLLKMVPEWLLWVIAGLTGLITLGIPVRSTVKGWKSLRGTRS